MTEQFYCEHLRFGKSLIPHIKNMDFLNALFNYGFSYDMEDDVYYKNINGNHVYLSIKLRLDDMLWAEVYNSGADAVNLGKVSCLDSLLKLVL